MRMRALIAAATSIAAMAGAADAASATTMRYTSGGALPPNSPFNMTLKAGTSFVFSSSAGNITCTSSAWSGWFGTNPDTPSVRGTVTAVTVGNCTDTIPFVTVSWFTTNVGAGVNAKPVAATYMATGSTFTVSGLTFTATFSNGTSCTYAAATEPATATHDSTTTPWNNEYAFNAVLFTKTGGTAVCSPTATWSATYVMTSNGVGVTIQP